MVFNKHPQAQFIIYMLSFTSKLYNFKDVMLMIASTIKEFTHPLNMKVRKCQDVRTALYASAFKDGLKTRFISSNLYLIACCISTMHPQ